MMDGSCRVGNGEKEEASGLSGAVNDCGSGGEGVCCCVTFTARGCVDGGVSLVWVGD